MQTMIKKWSPEQDSIFDWYANGNGNAMVEALAGTGKTTTIKEGFRRSKETRMLYAVFGSRNKDEAKLSITDPE